MRFVIAIVALTVLNVASMSTGLQRPTRYDNFAVYKVYINTPDQRHIINNLLNYTSRYNLWHNGRTEIHIMVSPEEMQNFRRIIGQQGLSTELLIPNVQALIDAGRRP